MQTPSSNPQPKKRPIQVYHQTTLETCGPSCAMMVLYRHRKLDRMRPSQELNIYRKYHSRVLGKGMTGAALADYLTEDGYRLKVALLHSEPGYMDNSSGYFDKEIFPAFLAEYQKKLDDCAHRIECRTGVPIDCAFLKQQLDAGKDILLECAIPGEEEGVAKPVLHWILLYRYQGDIFHFCDPLKHCRTYTTRELEEVMNTPVGRICLTVGF